MKQDRVKWNKKYRENAHPEEVVEVVQRYCHLAPGKKALDIAAGNGRHSLFLARQGFSVDAVDISEVGLAALRGKHANIHGLCADLDQFDIPVARYDLILNIKFLNRRLFPYIQEGLKPGGVLIFHTLLEAENNKEPGVVHHRDFLLRSNELLHAFLKMQVIYYHETTGAEAKASLVAVKKTRRLRWR